MLLDIFFSMLNITDMIMVQLFEAISDSFQIIGMDTSGNYTLE